MTNGLAQRLRWLFVLWLARRLPDCKQMTKQLGERLDRRPSLRIRIVTRLHLFTCDACQRYAEQVEFLKHALHANGEREPDPMEAERITLPDHSKLRIKALLRMNANLA